MYEQCPEVSHALLYQIVTKHLQYRKICARWVPQMLTDAHKAVRMGAALMFLKRYERDGNVFLDQIVTGDETWISHNQQTEINGVASFSVAKQATQIQTNSISPKTDGHCFLGPSRGPPC